MTNDSAPSSIWASAARASSPSRSAASARSASARACSCAKRSASFAAHSAFSTPTFSVAAASRATVAAVCWGSGLGRMGPARGCVCAGGRRKTTNRSHSKGGMVGDDAPAL
jgi:hypothetical protein